MNTQKIKFKRRNRRKMHVRRSIKGTSEKLRLTVFKSLNEIYAQIINDIDGVTLAAASSIDKELRSTIQSGVKKIDKSKLVGHLLAKRALAKDIKKVAFDRNGYIYHGRVKALADAAREGGLLF